MKQIHSLPTQTITRNSPQLYILCSVVVVAVVVVVGGGGGECVYVCVCVRACVCVCARARVRADEVFEKCSIMLRHFRV